MFISNKKAGTDHLVRSSSLTTVTTVKDDIERTDFIDADGKITFASNVGYATVLVTDTEQGKIEQYFDEKGNPVRKSNGQYALLREYDDNGNNYRTTYLGIDGQPVITASGYAVTVRVFDDDGNVITEKYYGLNNSIVYTSSYGYGKLNEYDEYGRIARITYLDRKDSPMMTGSGYAILIRNYYEDGDSAGKVESEFYFDAEGQPVALSLGQYGVHKEYDENGQEAVLTYLDAEGAPLITTKGYTTVKRTFHANNSVATEQYFDIDGNPYALAEGQYGIKRENGHTTYLNAYGREKFNIRNLLYNQSWVVIMFANAFVLISSTVDRKWNITLLVLYLAVIIYLTLMYRESGGTQANFELFWSYKKLFTDGDARADTFKNIWLFIPLGAVIYKLQPKRLILIIPVFLAAVIEAIQYFTGMGLCEFDDVFNNSLGAFIGFETGRQLEGTVKRWIRGACEEKDVNR